MGRAQVQSLHSLLERLIGLTNKYTSSRDIKMESLLNTLVGGISRTSEVSTQEKVIMSKKRPAECGNGSEMSDPKRRRTAFQNLTNTGHTELLGDQKAALKNDSVKNTNGACEREDSLKITDEPHQQEIKEVKICLESNIRDVDAEAARDPFQVSVYAEDIFQYYKTREEQFKLGNFMACQKDLTHQMRAILIEWLVEIQVNFRLSHETLYLAVKMVDQCLGRAQVAKHKLQLLGATALFIACKFEERCPPPLRDFLYICDNAYKRKEVLHMEREVLSILGFDIGYPISYCFLRRYAKCAHTDMQTLTLGRYLLETSLMDSSFSQERDSKVAAAALLLAMKMNQSGHWDATMVHYTGYEERALIPLVVRLNNMIARPAFKHLITIRSKYSHSALYKVAKTKPLSESTLKNL